MCCENQLQCVKCRNSLWLLLQLLFVCQLTLYFLLFCVVFLFFFCFCCSAVIIFAGISASSRTTRQRCFARCILFCQIYIFPLYVFYVLVSIYMPIFCISICTFLIIYLPAYFSAISLHFSATLRCAAFASIFFLDLLLVFCLVA